MNGFEEIYQQYFQDVYKYALSLSHDPHLAEEITQETFFQALRHIDAFEGKCKLYVWLCQIAKNTWFSYCRREKRLDHGETDLDSLPADGFEQDLLNEESADEIFRALHKLDEPYKEVFSLRLLGELSFARIAALFGKSESWARVAYHRAKLKIREELK